MEGAFSGQKGLSSIHRLVDHEHRLSLRKTIDRLKSEIPLASDLQPILQQIKSLQGDLNTVESRLLGS